MEKTCPAIFLPLFFSIRVIRRGTLLALFKFGLSAAPPARDFLDSSSACNRGEPFLIRGKHGNNYGLAISIWQPYSHFCLNSSKNATWEWFIVHMWHISNVTPWKKIDIRSPESSLAEMKDQNSPRDFAVRASQRLLLSGELGKSRVVQLNIDILFDR